MKTRSRFAYVKNDLRLEREHATNHRESDPEFYDAMIKEIDDALQILEDHE